MKWLKKQAYRTAWLGVFLLSFHSFAGPKTGCAELNLKPDRFSDLLGELSQNVTEIAQAQKIAVKGGYTLAIYGGTSRELINFLCSKIWEEGGLSKYQEWISKKPRVSLLDWHRLNSDLDFLLIDPNKNGATDAEEVAEDLGSGKSIEEIKTSIDKRFSGNSLYKKADVHLANKFFAKYAPEGEHLETISNIPIGSEGVLSLDQLKVKIDGKTLDLTEDGVSQYLSGKFEFRLASGFGPKHKMYDDTYGNFRQVMRWIRYSSEESQMELSPSSDEAIRKLLAHTLAQDRDKTIDLLQNDSWDLGKKTLDSLEKIQLYSTDSQRTNKLLQTYGLTKLAEDAGIADSRILQPLVSMPKTRRLTEIAGKTALGKEIVLYHRTSLNAAQNISKGALWQSNDYSIIAGKRTTASLGPGLYASTFGGALRHGDFYVQITLSPDAVEGVDYEVSGIYYVIKNLDAISKDKQGALKISKVTRDTLYQDQLNKLKNIFQGSAKSAEDLTEDNRNSLIDALSALINPDDGQGSQREFDEVLKYAGNKENQEYFLQSYLGREDVMSHLFKDKSPALATQRQLLVKSLKGDPTDEQILTLVKESPHMTGEFAVLKQRVIKELSKAAADDYGNWPAIASRNGKALAAVKELSPKIYKSLLSDAFEPYSEARRKMRYRRKRSSPIVDYKKPRFSGDIDSEEDIAVIKDALALKDPDLTRRVESYMRQFRTTNEIAFAKEFPDFDQVFPIRYIDLDDPKDVAVRFGNQLPGRGMRMRRKRFRPEKPQLAKIFEKLLQKRAVDADEFAVLETYLRGGDAKFFDVMCKATPQTQELAMKYLKKMDSPNTRYAAIELLSNRDFDNSKATKILKQIIKENPSIRPKILAELKNHSENWDLFPFKKSLPEDAEFLKWVKDLPSSEEIEKKTQHLYSELRKSGELKGLIGKEFGKYDPITDWRDPDGDPLDFKSSKLEAEFKGLLLLSEQSLAAGFFDDFSKCGRTFKGIARRRRMMGRFRRLRRY